MVSYSRAIVMMVAASNNLALKAFAAKALNSACFKKRGAHIQYIQGNF